MTEHSILPPSSAARRVACPGSRLLEMKYPDTEQSQAAREGEAAHWVASEMLKNTIMMVDHLFSYSNPAPNGERVTFEMIEGAQLYVDTLRDAVGMDITTDIFHIEERIDMPSIHPDAWGTPDCWVVNRGHLHILDYKYGFGFVEVFENWQLIAYAAGVLEKLKINGIADQSFPVTFYIVQPRSFHRDGQVRTWSFMASDLRPYFNRLRDAEHASMAVNALCRPNPECTFCRGRHACEALQRSSLSAVDVSTVNTPFDLNAQQTGGELRYLKRAADLLDARITGLSEQALSMIKRGERVPGFKAEASAGREIWKKSAEEIITLGAMMNVTLAKPLDVITPKQAVKAGMPEEIVKTYSDTPRGAIKLIAEDESASRKVFGK